MQLISFELMNELVSTVGTGQITLEPTPDVDAEINLVGFKDFDDTPRKLLVKDAIAPVEKIKAKAGNTELETLVSDNNSTTVRKQGYANITEFEIATVPSTTFAGNIVSAKNNEPTKERKYAQIEMYGQNDQSNESYRDEVILSVFNYDGDAVLGQIKISVGEADEISECVISTNTLATSLIPAAALPEAYEVPTGTMANVSDGVGGQGPGPYITNNSAWTRLSFYNEQFSAGIHSPVVLNEVNCNISGNVEVYYRYDKINKILELDGNITVTPSATGNFSFDIDLPVTTTSGVIDIGKANGIGGTASSSVTKPVVVRGTGVGSGSGATIIFDGDADAASQTTIVFNSKVQIN